MPVPAIPGETGGVKAQHGADLAGAKPGDELLEAWARYGSARGSTEVIINDLDSAESVAAGLINKVILAPLALEMDLYLRLCVDWRTYTIALRPRTVGGSGSAFIIADLPWICAGGFH